jgi:hypothetical protein
MVGTLLTSFMPPKMVNSKTKQTAGLLLLVLFLAAPYLPRALLDLLVGNRAGAVLVLLGGIYLLKIDMVLGVAGFLAAAALFLEHRRRIVAGIQEKLATAGSRPATLKEASRPARNLVPGEAHPPFDSPDVSDYTGEVDDKYDGGHDLAAEGPAVQNEKTPMETESNLGEVTHFLQSKGFNAAAANAL